MSLRILAPGGSAISSIPEGWANGVEWQTLEQQLGDCFFDIAAECPYGLPHKAIYRQGLFGPIPDHTMDAFLAAGFRRNGNTMYTMVCRECQGCVPIRLDPEEFVPNRSQRRTLVKNRDLTLATGPLQITPDRLALCDAFLRTRYPGRHSTAIDYYSGFFVNAVTNTMEVTYRLEGRLVGVGIVDITLASLNAVYFYFDPALARRGLGTYNILQLVELCRREEKEYLYLGYWIDRVAAMRYKAQFKPHSLLRGRSWQRVEREKHGTE